MRLFVATLELPGAPDYFPAARKSGWLSRRDALSGLKSAAISVRPPLVQRADFYVISYEVPVRGQRAVPELSALRGVNMQVHTGAAAIHEGGVRLVVVFQSEGRDEGRISDAPLEIDGRKLRLLIVEDDALIAMDLSVNIDELGGQVVAVAVTALDAIRLANEHRPDVVLMDVRLRGDLDGIDAARAIRHDSSAPVVFVTGNADSRTMRRMTDIEGAQVILKPVLINELRDAIIRAAGR